MLPVKRFAFLLIILALLTGCLPSAGASQTPSERAPSSIPPTAPPTSEASSTVSPAPPSLEPSPTAAPKGHFFHPTPTPLTLPTQVADAPSADTTPAPPGESLIDQYLPGNQKVGETEHFIFYANKDGYFPVDKDWWLGQAEVLYAYVSQRLDGAQVKNKIHLAFMPPDPRQCPVRGLAAYEGIPNIIVYADENSPHAYLLGVLSHELGHAIPSEGFPGGLPDELGLTEGLATWASGKYWLAWKNAPSYDALIARYMRQGLFEAPSKNYDMQGIYPWQDSTGPGCLDLRDRVYAGWGAFLGYLIDTYGWEKAYRLFQSPTETRDGKVITFPSDYQGIYGKSLNQLEYDWLSTIMSERIEI